MLDATSRAVSELGYPSLTVAAILERAGVSRKTFYEHFSDKEECFLAAYDDVVHLLERGVADAFAQGDTWRERMRSGLGAFLNLLASEPAFARMCIVEVLAAGPNALQRRDAAMRMFRLYFEQGRREAVSGKDLPEIVPEAVVGAIYEVIYARVLSNRTHELPDLLPQLVYVALVPFLGPDEAAKDYAGALAAG
jgi:AcrR family transcriptional regulator